MKHDDKGEVQSHMTKDLLASGWVGWASQMLFKLELRGVWGSLCGEQ